MPRPSCAHPRSRGVGDEAAGLGQCERAGRVRFTRSKGRARGGTFGGTEREAFLDWRVNAVG